MFQNFKRLLAIQKNKKVKIAEDIFHTKDGKAIIEAGIKDYSSVISPFCVNNYKTISTDFSNHIYTMSQQIPLKEDIEICLYVDEKITDNEKSDIAQAIKTHYAERIVNTQVELRRNIFRGATFAFIGFFIFLMLILFLDYTTVWFEIIGIAAWVFLWDSIEEFFYELPHTRAVQSNNYRLMSSKIIFKNYDELEKKE